MKKIAFYTIFTFFFFGCKSFIAQNMLGIGKKSNFSTKLSYFKHLKNRFNINDVEFFYADSLSYNNLLLNYSRKSKNGSQIIYGIYKGNDSILNISSSKDLMESCSGKNAKGLSNLFENIDNIAFVYSSENLDIKLLNIETDKPIQNSDFNIIVLVYYYYPFGKMYDYFYSQIEKLKKQHPNISIGIVILDQISALK